MTTITLPAPADGQLADGASTPARITRLTVPTAAAHRTHQAGFCYAAVHLSGRLALTDAATSSGLFPLSRRTTSGAVYRVALGDGITCWLDGDHLGHSINPVATQMCLDLSGGTFAGPDDAPFICGPVLFTGPTSGAPAGLSDRQLRRIVDAHAAASLGEPSDLELVSAETVDLL